MVDAAQTITSKILYKSNDCVVTMERGVVCVNDKVIKLTEHQRIIFLFLAANANRVLSHSAIEDFVYGSVFKTPERQTLKVHIFNIRSKLGPAAAALTNVWGKGYLWKSGDE